jgi:hypothetical protein
MSALILLHIPMKGTYASSRLLGPITRDLGLDGYFDIVNILPTLGRMPVLGFRAATISSVYSLVSDVLDILPGFPQ